LPKETEARCDSLSPVKDPTIAPRVRSLNQEAEAQWDRFVFNNERASFFHLTGWKRVIEKTFDFKAQYLYGERQGRIVGIAPFFEVSNWVVGRCLVSVPLAAYGGIVSEDAVSEQALLEHSKCIARSGPVDYLELRNRGRGLLEEFHANPLYVTFTVQLLPDLSANLQRLPKDTRYMIRKAEKHGLRIQLGTEQLAAFYNLFAQSMQRLGTPVFPRSLFSNLLREFPDHTQLLLVYKGSEPLTGVLSFFFRDTILPYFAGASPEANHLAANNFMYWELMKWAIQHGFRTFDFGRSKKGTGSFAFKSQWNMKPEQLDYQVYLVRRKTVPNFSPLNPRFERAIRIWRKLPLPVTNWLGPHVVRLFP
jgi:FemAB-related protein (PEP-CTERM system-associated)